MIHLWDMLNHSVNRLNVVCEEKLECPLCCRMIHLWDVLTYSVNA
jgi:hypothetical protein